MGLPNINLTLDKVTALELGQAAFHAFRPGDLQRGKEIFSALWSENLREKMQTY